MPMRTALALALATTLSAALCGCGQKKVAQAPPTPDPGDQQWLRDSLDAKKSPRLVLSFSRLLEDQGRLDEARKQYEQVLELADADVAKTAGVAPATPSEVRSARVGIARLDGALGDDAAALRGFEAALKAAPSDSETLRSYGAYQLNKDRLTEAEALLRRALAAEPGSHSAELLLGQTLVRVGQLPQAKQLHVAALGPVRGSHAYARQLMQHGHRSIARRELRQVIAAEPTNAAARQELTALEQTAAIERAQRQQSAAVRPVGYRQTTHPSQPVRQPAAPAIQSPQKIKSGGWQSR